MPCLVVPVWAQEDVEMPATQEGDNGAPEPAGPLSPGDAGDVDGGNRNEGDNFGGDLGAGGGGVEFAPSNIDVAAFNRRLLDGGFEIPETAFTIFPPEVQQDIKSLMDDLLPLLTPGREKEFDSFFTNNEARIATVFDQLGLEPNADGLVADAPSAQITFKDEYKDYRKYLDTLEIDEFEKEYMIKSHDIAVTYREELDQAQDLGARQQALERYQQELENINETYEQQFRDRFLENLDRAAEDGKRPDVDR